MKATGTQFEFVSGDKLPAAVKVLIVPVVADPKPPLEIVSRVDAVCDGAVSELIDVDALGREPGRLAHTTRSGKLRRVVAVSLGSDQQLDGHNIRKAAAAAARWLIGERITKAALWLDGLVSAGIADAAGEWAYGMMLAGYRFDEYRADADQRPNAVRIYTQSAESGVARRALGELHEHAKIAAAANYARHLAHLPGNVINPSTLATEARRLVRNTKMKCTVIDAAQAKRLKLGGLLAVGAGAAEPPCLIQIDYQGAPKSRRSTVLAGKAITFDTGGYSIKPSAGLEGMKFDKCGGMTVLGIMKAVADLKLKVNVTALIAAAENAVSDRAYRPGDILTMASGKTVEVISTDAEGRLVLADALWYAQRKLGAREIVDLATLTGGINIALGKVAGGIMSNNDELAAELGECGRRTGERLWRLPLWDEYRELIKGTDSDIKNSAGKRDAHAIVAGMFLKEFVEPKTAWAHLDIAAVATTDESRSVTGKGATGFGVRLLIDYLRRHSANA